MEELAESPGIVAELDRRVLVFLVADETLLAELLILDHSFSHHERRREQHPARMRARGSFSVVADFTRDYGLAGEKS